MANSFNFFNRKVIYYKKGCLNFFYSNKSFTKSRKYMNFLIQPFLFYRNKLISRVFIFKTKEFKFNFYYRFLITRSLFINNKLNFIRVLLIRFKFIKPLFLQVKKFNLFKIKFKYFFKLSFFHNSYIHFLYLSKKVLLFLNKNIKKYYVLSKKNKSFKYFKQHLNLFIKKKNLKYRKSKFRKIYLKKKSKFKKTYLKFWFFFFSSRNTVYYRLKSFYSKFLIFYIFYKLFI